MQAKLFLGLKTIALVIVSFLLLGALFFIPAGTLNYWQAWVYLAVLFIPMFAVMVYLLKHNPALLERRLHAKEKADKQKVIIKLASFIILLAFLLPGFDQRFKWSQTPILVVVFADVIFLVGYFTFFQVLKENSYAARTVEVETNQKVISSGPYAIVRHPMYAAIFLMYTFSPLALGSLIAVIPALFILPVLVLRILDEESFLKSELIGYKEYIQKTPFRLIPGIW